MARTSLTSHSHEALGATLEEAGTRPPDFESTWQTCLMALERRIPRPAFEICLRGSQAQPVGPHRLQITVGNGLALDMIRRPSRQNVVDAAREVLAEVMGGEWALEWMAPGPLPETEPVRLRESRCSVHLRLKTPPVEETEGVRVERRGRKPDARSAQAPGPIDDASRTDRFTFDTFVVGPANQLAAQAARQVAQNPGGGFNPLVIYGEAGLGKTHLMKAVRHHLEQARPQARVVFASTEAFTNELVEAIQAKKAAAFRRRYRQVDVLLIDDVEFLIGKERIQEEFYHTFEEVMTRGSQVILTCDRPPQLLTSLQDRLCSRLSSGLLADIQPPDLSTRMAILQQRARQSNLRLEEDVVRYIAEGFQGNVRQLEGALVRVLAWADAVGKGGVDLAVAEKALHGIRTPASDKVLTLPLILEKASEYFHVDVSEMVGPRRDRRISHARHIAMYLASELANYRCRELAEAFGGKDYSTVKHAIAKVVEMRDDPAFRTDLRNMYGLLGREPRTR